jgi:Ca2+-binding EF-hand superfamily protein
MRSFVMIIFTVVGTTAGPCIALSDDQSPETPREVDAIFAALDRDSDGRISKSEASKDDSLQERFAGIDADGDGYLSLEEFRARPSDDDFE